MCNKESRACHEALDVDAVAGVGHLIEFDDRQSQIRHVMACTCTSPLVNSGPSPRVGNSCPSSHCS